MAFFVGTDRHLYISYGSCYDSASWITDLLLPTKSGYTLKDVVIPGAHDAGMSKLNGVGGKFQHFVNKCNTLTQLYSVDKQLASGIRMFDLRVGIYKGTLYTKNAPSDCMEDSKGGGWGEPLDEILESIKTFIDQHPKEFVILNFSHFCQKGISISDQAKRIKDSLDLSKAHNNSLGCVS